MRSRNALVIACTLGAVMVATPSLRAQDSRVEAGARFFVHWSPKGTLVGDIQGYGGYVGYRIRPRWSVQAGVDHLYYDLEKPIDATGITPADPEPVDAFTDVWRVRADGEYHLRSGGRWDPYLTAGVAYYTTEADDAEGTTAGGSAYHLEIDTPSTFGVNVAIGTDVRLGDRFSTGLALAYGHNAEGYTVTDTVSGRSGKVDALKPWGLVARLVVRF